MSHRRVSPYRDDDRNCHVVFKELAIRCVRACERAQACNTAGQGSGAILEPTGLCFVPYWITVLTFNFSKEPRTKSWQ